MKSCLNEKEIVHGFMNQLNKKDIEKYHTIKMGKDKQDKDTA